MVRAIEPVTASQSDRPIPPRARLAICVLVAAVAAHYTYFVSTHVAFHRDLGHLWFAAREVLHRRNPYLAIGPRGPYEWPWPLYYPLPSILVVTPLTLLPEPVAMATFAAVSVGAFTWALGERGYAPLLALASFSVWHAIHLVQWSLLLAAATVLAPLSILLVAKPTVGAAVFAARPSRWAIVAGVALVAASFIVQPHWPTDWLRALNSPNVEPGKRVGHFAILQFPGGVLVLAALVRWRRPEARLLAVLACVPQTLLPYESVLLFLIPRGWIESATMTTLSYAMFLFAVRNGPADFATRTLTFGPAVTWFMYLPATAMVLRRPNEGSMPQWIEARTRRFRGQARRGKAA